mmetsp:Transcript_15611/g.26085  ORF Transcript_15611/g.26085 Transcript_15611/m.26085 type:complete len:205 (-) Transcript_15611:1300-1914(-)
MKFIIALLSLYALSVQAQPEDFAHGYVEPEWYKRIEAEFPGENVKRCVKRQPSGPKEQPATGEPCSDKQKTCFFGSTTCESGVSHPSDKCVCEERTWSCVSGEYWLPCPCPPAGSGMEVFNDPACPVDSASMSSTPCDEALAASGLSCQYGNKDCCGTCKAESVFQCVYYGGPVGLWNGYQTEVCDCTEVGKDGGDSYFGLGTP